MPSSTAATSAHNDIEEVLTDSSGDERGGNGGWNSEAEREPPTGLTGVSGFHWFVGLHQMGTMKDKPSCKQDCFCHSEQNYTDTP